MNRIVIVGAGLAGMRAAERFRELGYTEEIVILGAENAMPYHRPALSKQFLTGTLGAPDLEIEPLDELDAVWRLGTPVSRLDTGRRVLDLPGGEELAYDGLVIATGVEARRVNGGPHGHPRVVTMRTIGDAKRLQRALSGNRLPVVILGSGFTGCEIASSLRSMAREVTIIGRSKSLMANLLGPDLGAQLADLHRHHDVDLQLGVTIEDWALDSSRSVGIKLSNGTVIDAAAVVVAVGSVPSVSWLRDAGVEIDDGLVCEPSCHVVGLDDVVAAGDVAQWPNLRFDDRPRRTEHWTNAIEMGRAAAESLLAGRESAVPFMPIPRFWSEQHGLRIQAAGVPALGKERVMLEPRSGDRSVTGYVRGQQMMGIVGFDSSSAVLSYADELFHRRPVDHRDPPARQARHRRVSFLEAVRSH
ncbi:NAD(P)/FAD-dependent oxidoreductase [Amycolatopsis pigmentata]|uniref:NAD(P)/FAD-dependent oxidoreductase n=1 Tax=Amycolatopsis pigmentata TaxID=450801 RepID=A0ABW5FZL1_9PSEU